MRKGEGNYGLQTVEWSIQCGRGDRVNVGKGRGKWGDIYGDYQKIPVTLVSGWKSCWWITWYIEYP